MENQNYPYISDELLVYLKSIYPDILPREELTSFKQGILVGHQVLIDHLIQVKKWNEEEE